MDELKTSYEEDNHHVAIHLFEVGKLWQWTLTIDAGKPIGMSDARGHHTMEAANREAMQEATARIRR